MPYAANNKLSTSPIEGGIEITSVQYAEALNSMQEGKRLSIEDGQMVLAFNTPTVPEPEPEPTPEEIHAQKLKAIQNERDRRLALGFDYDFGDQRGVHRIGTTDSDMRGWDEVTKMAQTALNLQQPDAEINIKTDTGRETVTALEWQMILFAAGQHRQPIFNAAFDLREADPIPADVTDDALWPE